jgi:putative hydrolase of the HAD superfamily
MREKITLLIDADDTLWHNNIFYEQAIENFVNIMEKVGLCRIEIEEKMRIREMENVKHHGYGSVCFTITMLEVYREACESYGIPKCEILTSEIEENGKLTRDYDIELLPGVMDTLPILAEKFRLIIVTKGCHDEQMSKIKRSGIKGHFDEIIVVKEKKPEVYKSILEKNQLVPENTWMIGNSIRSDINPAKTCGIKTAYIPYHATWEFENEELSNHGHETVILKDFSEIVELF